MKKYIILIAFLLPLSIWAQSTTAKTDTVKVKKGIFKKKKAKKVKPVIVQEVQSIVPKSAATRVVNEPDTIIIRGRLIDTTFLPFSGSQYYVTFQKSCYECFRIERMPLDSNSNDTLAIEKIRYVFDITALVHKIENRAAVRRANTTGNSIVKQRARESAKLEKEAKELQDNIKKSGN